MMKRFFFFLLSFCFGILGGIWAQAFLLPGLASSPAFKNLQFIKDWNAKVQVVSPVQEIVIRENEGLERLVKRLDKVVVGLESVSGNTIIYGTFVILSCRFHNQTLSPERRIFQCQTFFASWLRSSMCRSFWRAYRLFLGRSSPLPSTPFLNACNFKHQSHASV